MKPDEPTLPRTIQEIHKRALDRRGRPCKSLRLPLENEDRVRRGMRFLADAIERGEPFAKERNDG